MNDDGVYEREIDMGENGEMMGWEGMLVMKFFHALRIRQVHDHCVRKCKVFYFNS